MLIMCVAIEAVDESKWVGYLRVPKQLDFIKSSLCMTSHIIWACVVWTSYSLGMAPLAGLRYLALWLSLLPAVGLQSIATGSKFQVVKERDLLNALFHKKDCLLNFYT